MAFKDNLLKKIEIDQLTDRVLDSLGSPGTTRKLDKEAMRSLLDNSPYVPRKERDLELWADPARSGEERILVLDNELPLYRTTAEDVALRKSPTVKEMINIGNVVKILSDKDVKLSKGEDTVRTIRSEAIGGLDLSFEASDIAQIRDEGKAALAAGQRNGVHEALTLFSELLSWPPGPRAFKLPDFRVLCAQHPGDEGETICGPIVLYHPEQNRLRLIDDRIGTMDGRKMEFVRQVAVGKEKPDLEGEEVFGFLHKAVMAA